MDILYIHIRHWLFWYGNYGFCAKSCNDEVTLYLDKEKTTFLGYFEITTILCLKYILENDIDKIKDKKFYNEIENFINSDKEKHFSYIYPRDEEDLEHQVKHYAPKNEKGHKPTYINMWTKVSDRLDVEEIKKHIKILAKEYLLQEVNNIEILNIPTYEETKLSYLNDYLPYVKL